MVSLRISLQRSRWCRSSITEIRDDIMQAVAVATLPPRDHIVTADHKRLRAQTLTATATDNDLKALPSEQTKHCDQRKLLRQIRVSDENSFQALSISFEY